MGGEPLILPVLPESRFDRNKVPSFRGRKGSGLTIMTYITPVRLSPSLP